MCVMLRYMKCCAVLGVLYVCNMCLYTCSCVLCVCVCVFVCVECSIQEDVEGEE